MGYTIELRRIKHEGIELFERFSKEDRMAADHSGAGSKSLEAVLADIEAEYARVADQRSLRRDPVSTYLNRLEDIVDPYIDTVLTDLNEKKAPDLIELIRKRRTALFLSTAVE
jgi:hypothetical protein